MDAGSLTADLEDVAALFDLARGERGPMNATIAIRGLLLCLFKAGATQVPAATVLRLEGAVADATMPLVEATAGHLPGELIAVGMGAVSGLAGSFGPRAIDSVKNASALFMDQCDFAAILSDALDTLHRQRALASRGNALLSHILAREPAEDAAGGLLH